LSSSNNRRIVTGFQNLHILRERVSRIAARKTKEECLDLPPRMPPIDIEVELSAEQVKIYNALVEAMGFELRAFFEGAPEGHLRVENAANLLSKLAQVSSGFVLENDDGKELCNGCEKVAACVESNVRPYTLRCEKEKKPRTRVRYTKENPKLAALAELLGGLLENPSNKVIVWAVFQAELDSIERMLEGRGFGHVRVDGRTGAKVKDRVDQFNSDPGTRVYLGQIATGVGITLNVASFTVYYSFDWSLRTYEQSIDRNYRAGQTKKVTVYRLLGRGTVDEYKVALLREKRDVSAVLTSKLACAVCRKRQECFANGTELFDPSCIYQGSVRRTIARPEVIEA
jgi:SNF2 family DNA or RNA helicase